MAQYEGVIEITKIKNSDDAAGSLGTLTARFVRYPASQQLSLWLPENGRNYKGNFRILNSNSQLVIEQNSVADSVNGSILLTWDTLSWPAGEYRLEIEHPEGGEHRLYFKKWPEGIYFPKDKIVEMPVATAQSPSLVSDLFPPAVQNSAEPDTTWNVYKDSYGNVIPNPDQILREELNTKLHGVFDKLSESYGPRARIRRYLPRWPGDLCGGRFAAVVLARNGRWGM